MKLPPDTIIARNKIIRYLLQWKPENDKSKFLMQLGYSTDNWEYLEQDIRNQLLSQEASFMDQTPYGDRYEIRGFLTGPNGRSHRVRSIWMIENETQQSKFITLFPDREG